MQKLDLEREILKGGVANIVFLHAHADDESFLTAGLMQYAVALGLNTVVVYCATGLVPGVAYTQIRQNEALAACKFLGVKDVRFLNFSEPKYSGYDTQMFIDQNPDAIADALTHEIGSFLRGGNTVLVSYDKNGGYGNKDHILMHKSARELYMRFKENVQLFEATINRPQMNSWLESAKARLTEEQIPLLSYWKDDFGLDEAEIDLFYELNDSELDVKKNALKIHESQIPLDKFPMNIELQDFRAVFGREYLARVIE